VAIEDRQVVGFTCGQVLRRFEAGSFFITRRTPRPPGSAAAVGLYKSVGAVSPPPDDVVMFDFQG
jgi:hypothetical protein